jgi:hypothetical protein
MCEGIQYIKVTHKLLWAQVHKNNDIPYAHQTAIFSIKIIYRWNTVTEEFVRNWILYDIAHLRGFWSLRCPIKTQLGWRDMNCINLQNFDRNIDGKLSLGTTKKKEMVKMIKNEFTNTSLYHCRCKKLLTFLRIKRSRVRIYRERNYWWRLSPFPSDTFISSFFPSALNTLIRKIMLLKKSVVKWIQSRGCS